MKRSYNETVMLLIEKVFNPNTADRAYRRTHPTGVVERAQTMFKAYSDYEVEAMASIDSTDDDEVFVVYGKPANSNEYMVTCPNFFNGKTYKFILVDNIFPEPYFPDPVIMIKLVSIIEELVGSETNSMLSFALAGLVSFNLDKLYLEDMVEYAEKNNASDDDILALKKFIEWLSMFVSHRYTKSNIENFYIALLTERDFRKAVIAVKNQPYFIPNCEPKI